MRHTRCLPLVAERGGQRRGGSHCGRLRWRGGGRRVRALALPVVARGGGWGSGVGVGVGRWDGGAAAGVLTATLAAAWGAGWEATPDAGYGDVLR